MKNLSKIDQLPQLNIIHSPTVHSKKPAPLISHGPASLNEIFEDEPKLKSPRSGDLKFGSLTARNFSISESRTMNTLTVSALAGYTPKTLKNINFGKKVIRVEKFNMMERITDLKSTLQKYKNQDLHLLAPMKADVKKTIKCLEVLNEYNRTDSVMTGVMDLVIMVLKGSIYVNPDMFAQCKDILIGCDNEELRKITLSAEQSFVPYYSFCQVLINELVHQDTKRTEERRYAHTRIEELSRAVEKKDREIHELHDKVNKAITKDVYGQILDELRASRDKCGTFFEENKVLKGNMLDLIEENKHLARLYDNEGVQVEAGLAEIARMKEQDAQRLIELEEHKVQTQQLQKKIAKVDSVLSISIDKIEEIKRQITGLQQKNDDLNFQNQRLLFKVSANGLEAFTPRPDYKSLQEEKKIELDMFDITGKNQTRSTAAVIEELMSKVADLTSKNSESPYKSNGSIQPRMTASRSQSRSRTGNFATNAPSRFSRQVIENSAGGGPGKSIFAARVFSRNSIRGGNSTPNPEKSKPRGSGIFTPNVHEKSSFNFDDQAIKAALKSNQSSPKERLLSLKDDPVSSLDVSDNSPSEARSDSGVPQHESKYILKIDIPRIRKSTFGGEVMESADELIKYIIDTKEELVV